jgi:hypothetical protein
VKDDAAGVLFVVALAVCVLGAIWLILTITGQLAS